MLHLRGIDSDIDEKLYAEFQEMFWDKVNSGQDPIICAMIFISQGLGVCHAMLDAKDFESVLGLVKGYSTDFEKQYKHKSRKTYH